MNLKKLASLAVFAALGTTGVAFADDGGRTSFDLQQQFEETLRAQQERMTVKPATLNTARTTTGAAATAAGQFVYPLTRY